MTHISQHRPATAHLPHLSDERIAQMTEYACSFPQETASLPRGQRLMNALHQFFSLDAYRGYRRASAMVLVMACLTLFVSMPITTQTPVPATPAKMTVAKADITQQESDISEYLIRDFLDEMV